MNVARRADGLLSAKQTITLLGLVEQHPVGRQEENILQELAAFYPSIWSRGRNTIALLRAMEVVKERDGLISISGASFDHENWPRTLGRLVAQSLADRLSDNDAGGYLQANVKNGGLWLDSMILPGVAEGLPLWIIEFSVATRECVGSRFWRVAEAYESLFLEGARAANRQSLKRSMSAAELAEKLEQNAIHGKEAEEWALAYEQHRLKDHPLIDQVRRISEDNVAAGYDIMSFSRPGTLHYDLFIEVKSYVGPKRFFWTRTEIGEAEKLGEAYSLYLVDRSRMNSLDYHPQIISGPYAALFQSQVSGWTFSPTTYECVAPAES